MKIDLHVHSKERSACGRASEEEQIRAAMAAGLDAIVFTDHHRLVPVERLKELNDRYAPFRIFGGIEITTNGEDVLILGLHDAALESSKWAYPDWHAFVREHGGFIILAHPFRYHPQVTIEVDRFVPDALEVHSINTPVAAEGHIREIASRLGIPVLCNSDAHSPDALGTHYNILERTPSDEQEMMALLRSGRFTCHHHR
jgi:histidinol phosphatase-like PHP family hydrolase